MDLWSRGLQGVAGIAGNEVGYWIKGGQLRIVTGKRGGKIKSGREQDRIPEPDLLFQENADLC